ncbi:BRD4-interacting chromatin-remodeling complex-associated protein-like [Pristis pectinata]|uniref:BRD4-interacting chromatin-remodeling complex-associated protein-like n=1 Tax=Pristis pectinata TaxID=685728 RepID=UPI00223DDBFC|nr:BRD4-interacting chromatin-remodeling complex-associated protein-like [Pristis pectinata]
MEDEDGRCLLDVICDPQALNDFLHGSNKVPGQTASAVEGFSSQVSTSTTCVEISFLEDDILGSPASSAQGVDEPCDILQRSLQEANITQQTLQEEADPAGRLLAQPFPQPPSAARPRKLSAGLPTDLGAASQQPLPATVAPQTLRRRPLSTHFVNEGIGVPQSVLPVRPSSGARAHTTSNGSPRAPGLGQLQMVNRQPGQTAGMSTGPNHQRSITEHSPSSGSYAPASPSEDPVLPRSSMSLSQRGSTLPGNSLFANASLSQSAQPVTVMAATSGQRLRAPGPTQNVTLHTTPPPVQPKHCVNIQPKPVQISPKPSLSPTSPALQTALQIQMEAVLQQEAPQNLTFVAGGRSICGRGQGHPATLDSSLTRQQTRPSLGKPLGIQVLNSGGGLVTRPPSAPRAAIPGRSQFMLSEHLAGTSAFSRAQQLSAGHAGVAARVLGSQGPPAQLGTRQSLPAQILTGQNVAGDLTSFGQVFATPNAQLALGHGRARLLPGPLQLQATQLAPSTLLQVPAHLSTGFAQPRSSGQRAKTVAQVYSLLNQTTVLNNTGPVGQGGNLQQLSTISSKSSAVQPQTSTDAPCLRLLQAHTPAQSPFQLMDTQHPPSLSVTAPPTSHTAAENTSKLINQQDGRSALNADQLLLFRQKEQKQQLLYQQALKLQQEKGLSLTSSGGLSVPVTADSVPTSVITGSGSGTAAQAKANLVPANTVRKEPKNQPVLPQAQSSHFLPALASQAAPGMITDLTGLNVALSKVPIQFQKVGKGITHITSAGNTQSVLPEEPVGSLKQSAGTILNKADLLLERFCKDQTSVMQPDCNTPFHSFEDTVFRLLPYHVCKGTMPSNVDFNKVDEEFEVVSKKLLKQTQAMLNKYRMLLFEESRRTKPSAEMVMIDRMFIQEEKVAFLEAKQLARDSPDAYISSVFQPDITNSPPTSTCLLVAPNEFVQSTTPITATKLVIKQARSWPSDTCATGSLAGEVEDTVASSRPSPMKTYTAGTRGGLRLKIKQEAGYSKVVHNTALDQLSVDPATLCSGSRGSSTSPFNHSSRVCDCTVSSAAETQLLEHLDSRGTLELAKGERNSHRSCSPNGGSDPARTSLPQHSAMCELGGSSCSLGTGAQHLSSNSRTAASGWRDLKQGSAEGRLGERSDDSTSKLMKELAEVENAITQGLTKAGSVGDLHWELPLPQPKRRKSDSVDNASFSSDSPQDSALNHHLQSAINSILDLQRLQTSEEEQSMAEPPESAELSISLFSPEASSGGFMQPGQQGSFVGAGTSTLEEAVNSILSD